MQSSCAHHVPHYTVQALRARGKRAVVLPHAFGLLSRSQRRAGAAAYAAAAYAIGFVAVVLGRFRQAPKKAVAPLELFDGRRELRHAAADTVLKKVEKHKHVQHVQMKTRGVHLSQLLYEGEPSYNNTWSAVVVRTQRIQQSLPKVEKQNTITKKEDNTFEG